MSCMKRARFIFTTIDVKNSMLFVSLKMKVESYVGNKDQFRESKAVRRPCVTYEAECKVA